MIENPYFFNELLRTRTNTDGKERNDKNYDIESSVPGWLVILIIRVEHANSHCVIVMLSTAFKNNPL